MMLTKSNPPSSVQVVMKDPKHIYLSAPVRSGSMICEAVERDSPIDAVLSLIEQQGLATGIARNCSLVGKRHDGSTIPVVLLLKETIQQVENKLAAALVCPTWTDRGGRPRMHSFLNIFPDRSP
jgi:hypothetical protein